MYRPTEVGEAEGRCVQQTGGDLFAVVTLRVEPLATDQIEVGCALAMDDPVRQEFLDDVVAGVRAVAYERQISGARVTLVAARYHEVDSRPIAYQRAARQAFEQAISVTALAPFAFDEEQLPRVRSIRGRAEIRRSSWRVRVEPRLDPPDGPLSWVSRARISNAQEITRVLAGFPDWVEVTVELDGAPVEAEVAPALEQALAAADPIVRPLRGPLIRQTT
jgi:Elongation factor G, domain IV